MTAAGVRQSRCQFCGTPSDHTTCRAHSDLPAQLAGDQWELLRGTAATDAGFEFVLPPLYDRAMHAARSSEAAPARIGMVS